ncbi:MAG TPA: hypothetical protein VF657_06455 [Actinoplanes sp.]|jgi:hypothetical protein
MPSGVAPPYQDGCVRAAPRRTHARHRQFTLAENLSHDPSPAIAAARAEFLLAATCGPQQNTVRAGTAAALGTRTPDAGLPH